jgi:hypothetical protein
MRFELRGAAVKQLGIMSDNHQMTKIAMMSRLVEWFVAQDLPTQSAVVGVLPDEIKPNLAKLILERMAKGRA